MECRQNMRVAAYALGVLVLAGGCSRLGAQPVAREAAAETVSPETTPVVYPDVVDSVEASAPVLAFKEYRVPGFGELEGYGDRLATIKHSNMAEGEPTTIDLLDFTTGKSNQAVSGAINFKNGFNIVGVSGGDRWMAWEELKGNEQEAPLEVVWKLYVAKIDVGSLTCGKPVLVDESEVSMHSRPLVRVDGDALYWMTNSMPNRRQEGAVSSAVVTARDLKTGTNRTVCETNKHYGTMSVGDGKVVVEQDRDSNRSVVRVVDPVSGEDLWYLDLMNGQRLSHFPQVHDGSIAWTVFAPGGLGYPDLFFRGTDGITHRVQNRASDPIQVGRYLFFDGIRSVPRGLGMRKNLCLIGGYDTITDQVFTLLEGEAEDGMWWDMPMGRGYSPDTFVISNDTAPWAESPEAATKAPLLIRRYTIPAR